ncbi:MAG: hypothetical protein IPM64_09675 [Phycisphaerales bacterium]|nr:hypothetical protein [Phycisphaerales bacterium]
MSASQSDVPSAGACSACGAAVGGSLRCASCGALLPADESDAFSLLGVAPVFDLAADDLRRCWLARVRQVHPDRARSDEERMRSQRLAALLNDAYTALQDPISRADRLLNRSGGPDASIERGMDPLLLAESLEIREALSEAVSPESAATIRSDLAARLEEALIKVAEGARALPGDAEHRVALRRELNGATLLLRLMSQTEGGQERDVRHA